MPDILRDSEVQTVVIPISDTTSAPVDGRRFAAYAVALPASFTGTALTFTSCDTLGGTYQVVYDKTGTAVTVATAAAARNIDIPPELAPWPFWRVVSNATEVAARTLTVVCKT